MGCGTPSSGSWAGRACHRHRHRRRRRRQVQHHRQRHRDCRTRPSPGGDGTGPGSVWPCTHATSDTCRSGGGTMGITWPPASLSGCSGTACGRRTGFVGTFPSTGSWRRDHRPILPLRVLPPRRQRRGRRWRPGRELARRNYKYNNSNSTNGREPSGHSCPSPRSRWSPPPWPSSSSTSHHSAAGSTRTRSGTRARSYRRWCGIRFLSGMRVGTSRLGLCRRCRVGGIDGLEVGVRGCMREEVKNTGVVLVMMMITKTATKTGPAGC